MSQGGDVIRSIREGTGARVKMDEVPPGLGERAIVILSVDRFARRFPLHALMRSDALCR